MNFSRYMKKCNSWMACAYKADKGTFGVELAKERKELYHYVFYGSAKIGLPFTSDYRIIEAKEGELINVKELHNKNIIFDFQEDTSMWGFNSLNEEDWDGKIVNDTFVASGTSVLVCLDGSPMVNNIMLSRYDYDELTDGKTYTIIPNNGVLALFTKK